MDTTPKDPTPLRPYVLVTGTVESELVNKVTALLAMGYRPVGGVSTSATAFGAHTLKGTELKIHRVFAQAMIRIAPATAPTAL